MPARSRSGSENSDSGSDAPARKKKEVIPDAVDHFLGELLKNLQTRNIAETHKLYEHTFNNLSDKHYNNKKRWPSVETVEEQISDEPLFLILYKELYYRHIYSHCVVMYDDRKGSWENYCKLLELIIQELEEDEEPSAALPAQWIWDILDEFIYHYQTYCTYRNKTIKAMKDSEVKQIRDNPDVFDTTKALTYLHDLTKASFINDYLKDPSSANGRKGAFTNDSVRLIGYFSVMQLMRMHSLLGDYHQAMKTVEHIDFAKELPLFYKIPACHVTLFYYMGFAYLMLRRYADAIRSFSDILVFLGKTSGVNSLSYQFDAMVKKQEQMYFLLLVCLALCPTAVDESLDKIIREKHGEKQARLGRGEELCFEELFNYACPKFISAALPDIENAEKLVIAEGHQRQLHLFLTEVRQQQFVPTLGAFMKLYTAITTSKLAQLCDMDEDGLKEQLMCAVHKTRQAVRNGEGSPLAGELAHSSEVEFFLDGDMVHINVHKPQRPHTEVFLEHIGKFQEIIRKLDTEKAKA